MPGVPRGLAEHRLRVDSIEKPVKEHLRRSAVQKRKAIGEEVARLLVAEFIREICHSEWLANVVMVPKKEKSLRMCIDFKHINRVCPKDHFPLPRSRVDYLVDAGERKMIFRAGPIDMFEVDAHAKRLVLLGTMTTLASHSE